MVVGPLHHARYDTIHVVWNVISHQIFFLDLHHTWYDANLTRL